MNAVLASYNRLSDSYDAIIVEGAGSPAEINLRDNDIANMGFAEAVDCPVIIVADIDRGGVFAHLIGTLVLLSETEQARVKGFVINRFRGDLGLLQSGLDWLEKETKKPVLGVLPYIQGLHLEAEDALPVSNDNSDSFRKKKLRIIVPALPRISNHTDFDPLRLHPDIDFQFIGPEQSIPSADLIILPGSKSVIADLNCLKAQGWEDDIFRHLRYGGKVMGICGGYQMLGIAIHDPLGIEGSVGSTKGLGLLEVESNLHDEKQLENISGYLTLEEAPVRGYEIHAGQTIGQGLDRPVLIIGNRKDGAISPDNKVLGCYTHGFFNSSQASVALFRWAGLKNAMTFDYEKIQEQEINRLADTIEEHLDIERLFEILELDEVEVV